MGEGGKGVERVRGEKARDKRRRLKNDGSEPPTDATINYDEWHVSS